MSPAVAPASARGPLPPVEELAARRAAGAALGAERAARVEQRCAEALPHHAALAARAAAPGQPSRQRLAVALRIVDELGKVLQPVAACRKGCDHCCHIRVDMTQLEAERLGQAIGRKPNTRLRYMPHEEEALPESFGYHTPCPFLAHGECSIYEHRPFGCRRHHSLDVDELFCRLDMPAAFSDCVPRLQPNLALLAYGVAMSASMGVADIRDWFPGPRELAQGSVGTIRKAEEAVEVANRTVGRPPVALGASGRHHHLAPSGPASSAGRLDLPKGLASR